MVVGIVSSGCLWSVVRVRHVLMLEMTYSLL